MMRVWDKVWMDGHSKLVPGLRIETGGTPSFSQLFEFCLDPPIHDESVG